MTDQCKSRRVMNRESVPLLFKDANSDLSLFFTVLCVIDIFGVFPIIALPRAIVQCGLYGIPLVLIVFGLQIYTAALLGKSWIIATTLDPQILRKNRHPLAAVTEFTLGPHARTAVIILLDLTVFCCGIPNLLVASQNFQIFGLKVSAQRFDLSFCYWLLVVGIFLCPLMWLGSPRDMKWVASISCILVVVTAMLVWYCIITDERDMSNVPVPTSPSWDKFISGYGMLAFQFDVHPTLMTVQVDMRWPQNISKAVLISFFVSGSLFGVTTALAVWKYGGSTTANVLQITPANIGTSVAILLAALQLCLSSALGHSPLFQHLEDQWGIPRTFGWRRCAVRSAIVFFGVAVGESVPRFDIVMALIGGSLTGPLVFVLPPLMYAKAIDLKERSMQTSTPEIYSGPRSRRSADDVPADPRVHSRSIYYGFFGIPKTDSYRYSYVYYDEADAEVSSDYTDCEDCSQNREDFNELLMTRRRSHESRPVFLDASQPYRAYRRAIAAATETTIRPIKRRYRNEMINWFGYLIVLFGIAVTVSSTYINIRNTIRYVQFTPPCIVNASVIQSPA